MCKNLYDLLRCKNIVDGKLKSLFQNKKLYFLLGVSQNGETYALSKSYTRNLLKAVRHKKISYFP